MAIVARGDTRVTLVHPGLGSGDYLYPPFVRSTQAVMSTTAQFVAYPFFVPHDLSVSALSIYHAATGAGSKVMFGVYSTTSRKPGSLLFQITAEIDLSAGSGAVRDGALSANQAFLQGSLYWLCANMNASATPANVTCCNNAAGIHNELLPASSSLLANSNANAGALAVANAYVANTMPATAPGSLVPVAATNLPLPLLKVA